MHTLICIARELKSLDLPTETQQVMINLEFQRQLAYHSLELEGVSGEEADARRCLIEDAKMAIKMRERIL